MESHWVLFQWQILLRNLANEQFQIQNQANINKQKMCKKKIAQMATNHTFLKAIDPGNSDLQKHFTIFLKPTCVFKKN